jgi:putative copper resistance protein D
MAVLADGHPAEVVLLGGEVAPLAIAVVLLALNWYLWASRRLSAAGRAWPKVRTVAAITAAVAALAAMNGWIAANDDARFSAHALQHVLLGLVVPLGIVLSAPLTLALRTSSSPARRRLRQWSGAPWLRVAAHPLVAGPLFALTIVGMYTTPLYAWSLTSTTVHLLVHAYLVTVGVLFFWPLVGFDPAPVRVPHPARVGLLLLVLPLHALMAVALMEARQPTGGATAIRLALAAGVDPMSEQHLGAGILWMAGEPVALVTVAVAMYRWWRADTAFVRAPPRAPVAGTPT